MNSVWHKSSRSSNDGNCVEVARLAEPTTAVRDSKNPGAGHLALDHVAYQGFLIFAKRR